MAALPGTYGKQTTDTLPVETVCGTLYGKCVRVAGFERNEMR
jgi:hypothetical protein